jgi:type III secretory pathway component EscR
MCSTAITETPCRSHSAIIVIEHTSSHPHFGVFQFSGGNAEGASGCIEDEIFLFLPAFKRVAQLPKAFFVGTMLLRASPTGK